MYKDEVAVDEGALVHVAQDVADRPRIGYPDELHNGKWARSRGRRPPRAIDIIFDLVGVRAAVDVHLVNAIHGQEFERIVDEGGIGEGQKALRDQTVSKQSRRAAGTWTLTYSRLLDGKGFESVLERVGEDLCAQSVM